MEHTKTETLHPFTGEMEMLFRSWKETQEGYLLTEHLSDTQAAREFAFRRLMAFVLAEGVAPSIVTMTRALRLVLELVPGASPDAGPGTLTEFVDPKALEQITAAYNVGMVAIKSATGTDPEAVIFGKSGDVEEGGQ